MEISSILIVIFSGAVSFGLGRTLVHFRNKRRDRNQHVQEAQAFRNRPPEKVSSNKAKRKRQLQQASKPRH